MSDKTSFLLGEIKLWKLKKMEYLFLEKSIR